MKYTAEQKKRLKDKGMNSFTKYDRFYTLPKVTIQGDYYVIESKMNQL